MKARALGVMMGPSRSITQTELLLLIVTTTTTIVMMVTTTTTITIQCFASSHLWWPVGRHLKQLEHTI